MALAVNFASASNQPLIFDNHQEKSEPNPNSWHWERQQDPRKDIVHRTPTREQLVRSPPATLNITSNNHSQVDIHSLGCSSHTSFLVNFGTLLSGWFWCQSHWVLSVYFTSRSHLGPILGAKSSNEESPSEKSPKYYSGNDLIITTILQEFLSPNA